MQIPLFIKDEYKIKQEHNRAELAKREAIVREKTTAIDEIELQKRRLAFELGTHAFSESDKDYESERLIVEQKIRELDIEMSTILKANGFPEDYLEPIFSCPFCHDTGYTLDDRAMCVCMKNRILRYNYASSDLSRDETFETYDLSVFSDDKQRSMMEKIYEVALQYAESLPSPNPQNLILLGSTGLGKSFTLNCIANHAMQRGLDVVKITAYNMFESILDSIRGEKLMPDYLSCDLLAIDDLGTEPLFKNITIEQLFKIVNEREARGKAIVIASNLSKSDIMERYDERIGSRLLSPKYSTLINMHGKDVRLYK